jgi:tRNA(fMet)-specific endonuclease VapC
VYLCTSVIVQCELLCGLRRRTQPRWHTQYQRLMESLDVMPLQADAVLHYAQLRAHLESAGTPLSPNDLLIAAHALALDAALVSADAAFARVPGLRQENWLE